MTHSHRRVLPGLWTTSCVCKWSSCISWHIFWGVANPTFFWLIASLGVRWHLSFWTPRKGRDPDFDFKKLVFVQEASGRQQEEQLMAAQSTVNNARKNSLQAAWNLFITNLGNDQVKQDKFLITDEMSSARARSVLVQSLEARIIKKSLSLVCLQPPHQMVSGLTLVETIPWQKMHGTAWRLISEFVGESLPTWDISLPKTAQGPGTNHTKEHK